MTSIKLDKSKVIISYIDTIAGDEVILFIHGLASSLLCWDYNIEYFKAKYRCIAMDLPGNGLSSKGDYPYTMEWFAEVVMEFINTLGLKKVHLAGHSMGGYIVTLLLDKYPEMIHKVMLIAPAGLETYHTIEKSMSNAFFGFGQHIISIHSELDRNLKDSFFTLDMNDKKLISQLMQMAESANTAYLKSYVINAMQSLMKASIIEKIKKYQDRIIIIFGNEDKLIPTRKYIHSNIRALIKDVKNKLSYTQIEIIPLAGHFVQWEQHQQFNKYCMDFLAK